MMTMPPIFDRTPEHIWPTRNQDAGATDLAATNYGANFNRASETTAFWLAARQ
jgi:hypothetical protein